MLILILIYVKYLQKGFNGQNYYSSDSHHPIKNPPTKNFHPECGRARGIPTPPHPFNAIWRTYDFSTLIFSNYIKPTYCKTLHTFGWNFSNWNGVTVQWNISWVHIWLWYHRKKFYVTSRVDEEHEIISDILPCLIIGGGGVKLQFLEIYTPCL